MRARTIVWTAATTLFGAGCANVLGLGGLQDLEPTADGALDGAGSKLGDGGRDGTATRDSGGSDATVLRDSGASDAATARDGGGHDALAPRDSGRPDVLADARVDAGHPCADAAPQSWTSINPGPLPGRDQAAMFWTGTDYLIFGGTEWGSGSQSELGLDGGPIHAADGGWAPGCGIWSSDGGRVVANPGATCSDGARYNPKTNTWKTISNVGSPRPSRWDMSWAFGNGQLFTFGGHGGSYGGWLYDLATDTWKQTSSVGVPSPRAYHVSYYIGTLFFVWGGELTEATDAAAYDSALVTGGFYDPLNDTWSPTSIVNAPPGGAYYSAASSDTDFFVWGGTQDPAPWNEVTVNVTNTGYLFNYASNSWKAISTVNAPSARRYAAAVWTGSKFVIYGGSGAVGTFAYNDGGIYDPVTDTWEAMAAGGPNIFPHTIVWSGKRVVLWGNVLGEEAGAPTVLAGALFDPVANAWDPVSTVNAPDFSVNVYTGYTNFWSGTQMLQWGGLGRDGGVAFPNAGELYTPPCAP